MRRRTQVTRQQVNPVHRGINRFALGSEMSTPLPTPVPSEPELAVDELLRRARPLPRYGTMVLDDLTNDEADAFLAAVLS
jgi:hypothetical protein